MSSPSRVSRALVLFSAITLGSAASAGEETAWSVKKSTGQVWITTPGAQQASLTQDTALKIGDTIRTGPNGRVLLVRGEETILISPNAVISLPTENKDGMTTTVTQQAGAILVEAERQNVKHFEVTTPYLAAVVKGTRFQVAVNSVGSHVTVLRGQVEVSDFKTGQIGQILPGQTAAAFSNGKAGLSLTGSGRFYPIEQGAPRPQSLMRIDVPKAGLSAPRGTTDGLQIHAIKPTEQAAWAARANQAIADLNLASGMNKPAHSATRLTTAIGDVHLDFGKITHGMARGAAPVRGASRSSSGSGTIWGNHASATASASQTGTRDGNGTNGTSSMDASIASTVGPASNTNGNGSAGNPSASTVAASVANGNSSGNGNAGSNSNGSGNANANGNGNGGSNANGNGNGNGNVTGNGNGNGNSGNNETDGPGNGHGHAYGWHRDHH